MSIELPNNPEEQITKEQWDGLKKRAGILFDRVIETPAGVNHYSHIARNRAGVLSDDWINLCEKSNDIKAFHTISRNADTLETYFSLLDEFPDFKEAEVNSLDGMFPDIPDTGEDALTVVQRMEERLRSAK